MFYLKDKKLRVTSWPIAKVDNSEGTHRGNVYVVWSGRQTVNGTADILMFRGTPSGNGVSWSNIIAVESSSTTHDWMAAPSVSPDGILSILNYSTGTADSDPIFTLLRFSTDGGNSFSSPTNVGSNNGFTIGSANTFMGEYQGLTSWLGRVYPLWSEYKIQNNYNERQIYFKKVNTQLSVPSGHIMVEVNQLDESSQPFGKVGRWNQGVFTQYTVPDTFLFREDITEVFRASQEFKSGTTQKYNQWNLGNNFYDIINHKSFPISANQKPIKALFASGKNEKIVIDLSSAGTYGTDSLDFKDPWLIDYNDPPFGLRNQGMNAP